MTDTRIPKDPGNQKPNHERYMADPPNQTLKPGPDGGLYIYHALAFSTLLSSQETDAHRVSELSFRPSRRLFYFTRFFRFVKPVSVRIIRAI